MAELLKLNFEKEFEKFKTKIELLNEKENNFEDNLKNYCEFLRGSISIKTESLINDLNRECNKLCEKLDTFEKEFIAFAL
jgi:hypothetical protein